jgi:molybdopterin converting factor small subunit
LDTFGRNEKRQRAGAVQDASRGSDKGGEVIIIQVTVLFHSYFKDSTGCDSASESLPVGSTLDSLLERVFNRFPQLEPAQKSMLMAVGVEYQKGDYVLKDGDEVSLFPPVQGG